MDGGLIAILIKNVLIPEVMAALKRRRDKNNGVEPTPDEVFAELDANIDLGVAMGKAYLARTEPEPVPPV